MKLKSLYMALGAAFALGATASANATIAFQFNPDGNGTGAGLINGGLTIDQLPGSTVAVDGVNTTTPGAPLPVGTIVTNYYQANLNSIVGAGSQNLFTNGTDGNYFTFVASYTERVTGGAFIPATLSTNFRILSGTFKMCAQTALGNDLAGTGFGCAGDGILSGSITGGTATVSADFWHPLARWTALEDLMIGQRPPPSPLGAAPELQAS